ncbi:MAG: putative sulfate exporter family transporter [Chloroflexi bacterium HGW-Chloroflexi-10]|nr:MAG: putative sulfate exporter family transporter [Chloroflexi bacterium HGW-Chloroflexi-10]
MNISLKKILPGTLLALSIAGIAYALGRILPVIGGPVIGIALGIILTTLFKIPASTQSGLKFTSKTILQLAVILLGFEMNLANIVHTGRQSILIIFLTIGIALLTAFLVGRANHIPRKLTVLVGVGTAICGGSAIAAAASAIEADDQEISHSISTIFLFNVIAVFLFPLIGRLLHLSDLGFGLWAGTAINDTSSVVAAGYSFSNIAGNFATIVKLTRSLMIIPVTLILAFVYARRNKSENHFNPIKVFPWFIIGFLLAALLSSTGVVSGTFAGVLVWSGKFLIIAALSAIGFNTDLKKFIQSGPKILLTGGITWLVLMISALIIQYASRMI